MLVYTPCLTDPVNPKYLTGSTHYRPMLTGSRAKLTGSDHLPSKFTRSKTVLMNLTGSAPIIMYLIDSIFHRIRKMFRIFTESKRPNIKFSTCSERIMIFTGSTKFG